MDIYPQAFRRSNVQLDRLNKICNIIAANPGIQKEELCTLYYGVSKYRTTDQIKCMKSTLLTLCYENRIFHRDHHYFILESE